MIFEVGKLYRNRSGAIVRITKIDSGRLHQHTRSCLKDNCRLAEFYRTIEVTVLDEPLERYRLSPDGTHQHGDSPEPYFTDLVEEIA